MYKEMPFQIIIPFIITCNAVAGNILMDFSNTGGSVLAKNKNLVCGSISQERVSDRSGHFLQSSQLNEETNHAFEYECHSTYI